MDNMKIDPVCGMEIENPYNAETYEYKGIRYCFCSMYCKRDFIKNPEKYLFNTAIKNRQAIKMAR